MNQNITSSVSPKNFWLILINALVLGWAGAHRFAVGKTKSAFLQLFTLGGFGVWVFIDVISILRGQFTDKNGLLVANPSKIGSTVFTAIFTVSVLVRLSHLGGGSSSGANAAPDSPTPVANTAQAPSQSPAQSPAQMVTPSEQKAFSDAVTGFSGLYDAAPNELKKSAIRASRKAKLQELVPSLEFHDWVGRLDEMSTTSKGNAALEIKLAVGRIRLVTHTLEFGDIDDKTLIPIGSSLFNQIADLKTGLTVKVSGRFIAGEQDYVSEASLTEDGAMTRPKFVVQFSQVQKAN